MNEIADGLHHWTAQHPKIGQLVNSWWLPGASVAIDPLAPPTPVAEAAQEVVLSNRHHFRDSAHFARATVSAPRAGLHEFSEGQAVHPYDPGDRLVGGAIVVHEVGGICPDDMALELPGARALLLADGAVRGPDAGELGFVPDALMDDPPATKAALLEAFARLAELDFDHLLLAHGEPIMGEGRAALHDLVAVGGRTAFEL